MYTHIILFTLIESPGFQQQNVSKDTNTTACRAVKTRSRYFVNKLLVVVNSK